MTVRPGDGASWRFVLLLSVTCAVTVANLYYLQPLLEAIATDFGTDESAPGMASGALQLGYAAGLLLLVPLGDIVARRPLVCGLYVLDAVALTAMALAPSLGALTTAAVFAGLTTVAVQILVPFAATVATDEQRNRVLGSLLSAMLLGVLVSRVLAGLVADAVGWRGMFVLAAVFMLVLALVMARVLGRQPAEVGMTYGEQMRSIAGLVRTEPVLRRRSIIGAAGYGAFNVLWTTIAFLLAAPPHSYGQSAIGLFAMVGVAGVAAAWLTGRAIPGHRNEQVTGIALAALLASFLVLGASGNVIALVVAGVLVLDAAVQAAHLLNQNTIYALRGSARARLTTVYMTSYFVGGSAGSALGAAAYTAGGWPMACVAGGAFALVALGVWAVDARAKAQEERAGATAARAT